MKQPNYHRGQVSRRGFLKTAAMGAAGLLVASKLHAYPWKTFAWRETFEVPIPPKQDDTGTHDREYDIEVVTTLHELLPGVQLHMLTFNGQVPGPEIRVREGEWVKVRFTNKTELLHTIHWHGVDVYSEHDGVPYVTQKPVMPGQTFVYKFQAYPLQLDRKLYGVNRGQVMGTVLGFTFPDTEYHPNTRPCSTESRKTLEAFRKDPGAFLGPAQEEGS